MCVLEFKLPDISKSKMAKLGTKFYRREYCQTILIDNSTSKANYVVFADNSDKTKEMVRCETVEAQNFVWNVDYERDK